MGTWKDRSEWIQQYENGATLQAIADAAGRSLSTVHAAFVRRGIKIRPRGLRGEANHRWNGGGVTHASRLVQYAFSNACRRGKIERVATCSECGLSPTGSNGRHGVQGHHDNYNKPFDVRWLCVKCHVAWHTAPGNRAIQARRE